MRTCSKCGCYIVTRKANENDVFATQIINGRIIEKVTN